MVTPVFNLCAFPIFPALFHEVQLKPPLFSQGWEGVSWSSLFNFSLLILLFTCLLRQLNIF